MTVGGLLWPLGPCRGKLRPTMSRDDPVNGEKVGFCSPLMMSCNYRLSSGYLIGADGSVLGRVAQDRASVKF